MFKKKIFLRFSEQIKNLGKILSFKDNTDSFFLQNIIKINKLKQSFESDPQAALS